MLFHDLPSFEFISQARLLCFREKEEREKTAMLKKWAKQNSIWKFIQRFSTFFFHSFFSRKVLKSEKWAETYHAVMFQIGWMPKWGHVLKCFFQFNITKNMFCNVTLFKWYQNVIAWLRNRESDESSREITSCRYSPILHNKHMAIGAQDMRWSLFMRCYQHL